MPRIRKRRVCKEPIYSIFTSTDSDRDDAILMTVDEYEALRLIDKEGLSQEECAVRLKVARTTAQLIYNNARIKLVEFLTEGRPLSIEGGNYGLCTGDAFCYNCRKSYAVIDEMLEEKGDCQMRIAVTYENGEIYQHFGHTQQFKLYDVADGAIVKEQVVGTNGQGHGALGGFLAGAGADILICGGIGGGAQAALDQAGIQLYAGVSGNADQAVKAYLEGNLVFSDAACSHHGEGHDHSGGCGHGHEASCHQALLKPAGTKHDDKQTYEKYYYDKGKLVGAILIGDTSSMVDIMNKIG